MSESDWKKAAEGIKALLDAVFPSISATGIEKIAADAIAIQKRAVIFDDTTIPGCLLSKMDELERVATVTRNDTGYGVGVTFIQAGNRSKDADIDQLQYWRELAKDTLRNKRINSAGVYRVDNEPRQVIDPAAFGNMYDVTSFTARCWVRST